VDRQRERRDRYRDPALDVEAVQRDSGITRWAGLPKGTTIGHVHFYVNDLAVASTFYVDGLGYGAATVLMR
jgi:catechol 2,3-dioxygenase